MLIHNVSRDRSDFEEVVDTEEQQPLKQGTNTTASVIVTHKRYIMWKKWRFVKNITKLKRIDKEVEQGIKASIYVYQMK